MNLTVRELADWVGGEVLGDGTVPIRAARTLSEAGPGDITFVDGDRNLTAWRESHASAAIVTAVVPLNGRPLIRVTDPLAAFATVVLQLRGNQNKSRTGKIDPTAHIDASAVLGPGTTVGPYVVIGAETVIGAGCHIHAGVSIGQSCRLGDAVELYPNVVLYDDCILGDRVIVHANSVIGADGFGYRMQGGRHIKSPQLGRVELADDVEIGACSTIDRGTFGATRIGVGTKIDNLVQIAHNCQIGKHNLIVSQVGIAGSSTTGDYVVVAGQAGVGDHINVGDRAIIGAKAGLSKDVPAGAKMLGAPAHPDIEQKKIWMSMAKLPEMRKEIRRIKKKIGLEDE
ncbi:UDP-3-O-(3-hydroxymyristoyl)glucosamine N-acyltransferase [Fimbriiglobus ruber]|uniref:UDP-3-O-acylglucosamine N-acyltransferase n=1 Tax=Fimbriiglobus ruber TaxID=1908690 RepID=A0A225E0Y7_9BACT|nr:UDP-3-O-(3-hydroxymyristoyl)glucosamine N-acyltransferase [Fimbriiglobus ruber]OWK47241.1 UDP-3-O-[3-hydroxymyristoyl] glucosamine N-acyltransferase [Fimbriiglobus ruber]